MGRVVCVVVSVLLTTLLQPVAASGERLPMPPVVELEGAWVVQKGAAAEVAYTITCPDLRDSGYHHALTTNDDYLEFRCGPRPRRVVQLLDGPVTRKQLVGLQTVVYSPECLYAGGAGTPDGPVGCDVARRDDTVRVRSGLFVPESAADRGGEVRIVDVAAVRRGGLRLTGRFTCTQPFEGWVAHRVSQVTPSGYTVAEHGGADRVVACEPGQPRRVSWVTRPQGSDPPFAIGRRVVVQVDWVYSEEGGPWGRFTGLLKAHR